MRLWWTCKTQGLSQASAPGERVVTSPWDASNEELHALGPAFGNEERGQHVVIALVTLVDFLIAVVEVNPEIFIEGRYFLKQTQSSASRRDGLGDILKGSGKAGRTTKNTRMHQCGVKSIERAKTHATKKARSWRSNGAIVLVHVGHQLLGYKTGIAHATQFWREFVVAQHDVFG